MKKYFLLALILWGITPAYSTILNVNNWSPQTLGQYNNLQDAINDSNNNDTIYVTPSMTEYVGGVINKPLTIIGAGFNAPSNGPTTKIQWINSINPTNTLKVFGVYFTWDLFLLSISNATFTNCIFDQNFHFGSNSNSTFRGCIFLNGFIKASNSFTSANPLLKENTEIYNCIFNHEITTEDNLILSGSINGCLFLGNNTPFFIKNAENLLVTRCIFYGTSPLIDNINNNTTVANAISFGNTTNSSNATITGLILQLDPLFKNYTLGTGFKFSDNYELQSNSPGSNFFVNGDPIGVYTPLMFNTEWKFSMTGEPIFLPQILGLSGSNSPVSPGMPLQVSFSSVAPLAK